MNDDANWPDDISAALTAIRRNRAARREERRDPSPYVAGHRAWHAGLPADPPGDLAREDYSAWRQGWTDARMWSIRRGGRANVQTR